ncbi:phosphotransferase [Paenibacillus sp. UNC451MF]|uniref:phosphotransferase n=1 Tax=Paenibacillus sp. UNC451MF TaxID=1449063 RepID=UPI00048C7E19|nr:phosphotransferase [Paenibacillus sp. UNC451MF]
MDPFNFVLVQDDIVEDMESKFGWRILSATPSPKGNGNLCRIMNTDNGPVFVKQFGKARNKKGLAKTREALKYQDALHHAGGLCQPVYSYAGEPILVTKSEEEYMVSGVSKGQHIEAGEANKDQMFSLGRATGFMHAWMRENLPSTQSLQWELPSKEAMHKRLDKNLQETLAADHVRYAQAIEKQSRLLEQLSLDELKASTPGWTHWDMHVDNLMFHEDRLADILDFDRVHYVYPDFDISRALLSCSYSANTIPIDSIKAYVEGYTEYARLSEEQLVRSIKLTWYKEFKWVHAMYSTNKPMSRFIEELIWIGDHWHELQEVFIGACPSVSN